MIKIAQEEKPMTAKQYEALCKLSTFEGVSELVYHTEGKYAKCWQMGNRIVNPMGEIQDTD